MCQSQYRQVFHMAWWQFSSGCSTWDLVETSPLVSRDLCNLHQRPGSGNCPDSCLLSDLLGGRRFLPGCWSHPLLRLQGRSEPRIAVQSAFRFAWGKCQCSLSDERRSWTTWWHDHPWKIWEPREFFPVRCKTVPVMGIKRFDHETKVKARSERWNLQAASQLCTKQVGTREINQ